MRIVKAGIAVLCVAFLSGCSIYKEYERPQLEQTADAFGIAVKDTTTIADISWKDFFNDPILRKLIEEGLKNNPDIRISAKKVLEAEAAMKIARLNWLPQFNFSPSFGDTFSQERYSGNAYSFSVPGTMSWELDLTGKLLNERRRAKAVYEQAEIYNLTVQTELISSIANCYYTLLKLDAQLDISETTSANWKENLRIMRAMKEAGMTNEASVSQTEANACSIEASLYDLHYQIKQMENTMAMLLGRTPGTFERGKLRNEKLPASLAFGVPAQLLSKRPDVMNAEYDLRKAYYDTAIARSAFYPSLRLTGEIGWEKALTSAAGLLFSAGASSLTPIFNGGRVRGNVKIAEARQEEALENFRKSILRAGNEVNDALALCESAEGKTEVRKQQIAALESAVTSTKSLMSHSESTYLEVLTAQQSLLNARLQQVTDRYDAVRGKIALYRALGGGIK